MLYFSSPAEVEDLIELDLLRLGGQRVDAHLDDVHIETASRIQQLGSYHLVIGRRHLVIDPSTGSWAVLCEREWEIYSWRNYSQGAQTFGALSNAFPQYASTSLQNFLTALYRRGLVAIDSHYPYSRDLYDKTPPYRDALLLELLVSEPCNLRCRYCQSTASKKWEMMSLDVAQASIDRSLMVPFDSVILEISGGEPLLNFPVVSQIIPYAEKRFAGHGKTFLFNIVTNGTLLTPEIAGFIKDHEIKLTLSLDGQGHFLHGLSRPLPGGQSSWGLVEQGIELLRTCDVRFSVVTTVHRNNFTRGPEIVRYLAGLRVSSAKFNPVMRVGRAARTGDDIAISPAEYLAFMKSALDTLVSEELALREAVISQMINRFVTKFRDYRCMRGSCGAGNSYFLVDPRGDIFPCAAMTGYNHLKLGSLAPDTGAISHEHRADLQIVRKPKIQSPTVTPQRGQLPVLGQETALIRELNARYLRDTHPCSSCQWRAFCTGGCAAEGLANPHADVSTIHDINCEFYLGMYPYLIEHLVHNRDAFGRFLKSKNFPYGPAWIIDDELLV